MGVWGDLSVWKNGAPERIRTSDPQIRSLVLYPAELRARNGLVLMQAAAKGKRHQPNQERTRKSLRSQGFCAKPA